MYKLASFVLKKTFVTLKVYILNTMLTQLTSGPPKLNFTNPSSPLSAAYLLWQGCGPLHHLQPSLI